ncbi:MAG: M1 family metallopeptidase [Bacteroidota bacterium]
MKMISSILKYLQLFGVLLVSCSLLAQDQERDDKWDGKFEQLGQLLPTPNVYRASDGAPGQEYWQQQADYKIKVRLDEEKRMITGSQTVKYYNNSPQPLTYLWIQLDQNKRAPGSDNEKAREFGIGKKRTLNIKSMAYNMNLFSTEGGIHITKLTDAKGKNLPYTINKTMMRIDLPKPLKKGETFSFEMSWWYNINDRFDDFGRSGYEYFPEDDNYVFTIAQFYPRLAVYDDFEGWQHKQFLGDGEFALTFGDYEVEITVPDDHILAATGELQNAKKVLSNQHYNELQKAKKSYTKPHIIVSQEEAVENEGTRSSKYQTWKYKAKNVRDFAFASSRKFIWDAQAVKLNGKEILAMSLYPKEGNPLWEQESTKAVVNTIRTYSKYTVDYPYPVATTIHAASIGMEYPMICFNLGRPKPDGTYTDATKYAMIGVIIHEVGHNFFPMIINSDERQWAWMDEGLNSYLEYRTQKEQYENFPFSRGPATTIVNYMKGSPERIRPMMTNPEQVMQLGNNAYGKPAAALNILRETIMKPELFDKAFKTFAERWAFKHPKPADFFRTMEDASAIDLDWFWRGWFYGTEYVDIAIDKVDWLQTGENATPADEDKEPQQELKFADEPEIFVLSDSPPQLGEFLESVPDNEYREMMKGKHFYDVKFSNIGGLVMPILLEFEFMDGSNQNIELPVEIWRKDEREVRKLFYFDKQVKAITVDANQETADVNTANNSFPRKMEMSEFEAFKTRLKG